MHFFFSINVELVAGEGLVKYVLKYVMKGAEMAIVEFHERGQPGQLRQLVFDEFRQLRMTRFVTSMEAFMELWSVPIVRKSNPVRFITDQIYVFSVKKFRKYFTFVKFRCKNSTSMRPVNGSSLCQ